MNSPARAMTTTPSNSLSTQLDQIGLHAVAGGVDDFLARATKQRWSPLQILEHLAQTEAADRAHRSLERRLRLFEIKKFKPIADFTGPGPQRSNGTSWNAPDPGFPARSPQSECVFVSL